MARKQFKSTRVFYELNEDLAESFAILNPQGSNLKEKIVIDVPAITDTVLGVPITDLIAQKRVWSLVQGDFITLGIIPNCNKILVLDK